MTYTTWFWSLKRRNLRHLVMPSVEWVLVEVMYAGDGYLYWMPEQQHLTSYEHLAQLKQVVFRERTEQ